MIYLCLFFKEQFINCFVKETYKHAEKEKNLDYKHFSTLVTSDERFQFLAGMFLKNTLYINKIIHNSLDFI